MKTENGRSFAPDVKSGGQQIKSFGIRLAQLEAISSIHGAKPAIKRCGILGGGRLEHKLWPIR